MLLVLLACHHETEFAVHAIVDPDRPEHFFDMPFPSNDMLDSQQFPDLDGFPEAPQPLAEGIVRGWATRLGMTANGFGINTAAYFRFDGDVDVPTDLAGTPEDPVLLVRVDAPEQVPVITTFVADPMGDPYWAPHTLAIASALGHPLQSGGTYAAVVMQSAGVGPAEGWETPRDVRDALDAAGVEGDPAVATVFTVQDATGQLKQLFADDDTRLGDWGDVQFQRVTSIDFAPGLTPSGNDTTIMTATFEGGGTELTYLEATDPPETGTHFVDLGDPWPMAVYQAYIPMPNYSGLEDRPYMSPGVGTINDTERYTGWIDFVDGQLVPDPDIEMVRIVVSIPKDAGGEPIENAKVMVWDHGTSGHAYESVQRKNKYDDGLAVATVLASHGYATIGRDAPLYGTRFPLIDEGFPGSLGFYNIVNLPAFRDNQRQTAVDGHTLLRYIQEELDQDLPAGSVDPASVVRFGHSLGSVTANLGVAGEPDAWNSIFLSGSGGLFTHYFLDTGLLDDISPDDIALLFGLVGATPPDDVTAPAALGAILGLDEDAWVNVNRFHPVITLFQWTMDPSDPMSVARDERLPASMLICTGDHQVPNFTSEALAEALPDVDVLQVDPTASDYDPHNCLHREVAAQDFLGEWLP
jgi:hypothetical protein